MREGRLTKHDAFRGLLIVSRNRLPAILPEGSGGTFITSDPGRVELVLKPSGILVSNKDAGKDSEAPNASLPLPAHSGFAEQSALFRQVFDLPPELRPLRGHLDPVFLRWTAAHAESLGIDSGILVARSSSIDHDALLAIYAASLGVEIDKLEDTGTAPFDAQQVLSRGEVPAELRGDQDGPTLALFGGQTRTACERAMQGNGKFRITSAARLRAFVERSAKDALALDASSGLMISAPAFSAAHTAPPKHRLYLLAMLAAMAAGLYVAPHHVRLVLEVLLACLFLTWAGLRLFACVLTDKPDTNVSVSDRDLPIYTILIPLYREANVARDIVSAIASLNYPREKLDVKLILEQDDAETIDAVNRISLDPCFEVVLAPALAPRTKPKALRAAMPFVHGEFVVIYDAEDRPDPDQLRAAIARFREGDSKLACVQARLAVDNAYPSFLANHFRAEYAGLFDVLLPALARLGLPFPLGGTSNHFRTSILREVGAWDPHNVTEDADLGVRLARFGYTTGVVDSTTWEEAPTRLGAWLPQRTRWMKGWLQTFVVHMRDPLLLLRQLGWRGFLCFQLMIGGSVLAALIHPVFAVLLLADSTWGSLLSPAETPVQWMHKALTFVTLTSGYIGSGLLAFIGMKRRGFRASAWGLLTLPVYWLLLSAAAWRALWKLMTAPHQWEKTAHGVAKRTARKV